MFQYDQQLTTFSFSLMTRCIIYQKMYLEDKFIHCSDAVNVYECSGKHFYNFVYILNQACMWLYICSLHTVFILTGNNCSEYIQSQEFALWRLPFHCEVTMTTSHPHITVDDLIKVVNAFDAQSGMF